jgi:hypothetical protein
MLEELFAGFFNVATCRASREEKHRTMPGDALVPDPIAGFTHAITIVAKAEQIWPWLAQMGAGRAGWYSLDWLDNGGRPSAKRVIPAYQNIAVGDLLPGTPGATEAFFVAVVEPPRNLVLTAPAKDGTYGVSWEFLLEDLSPGRVRLAVRARLGLHMLENWRDPTNKRDGPILVNLLYRSFSKLPLRILIPVAGIGHGLMEVKQLRGIKRRAERI